MSNPWLTIPLADYEGHMRSPVVAQLDVLADLFAAALKLRRPASVAVLGIAGGNGLDRVDGAVVRRVVGLDLNAEYLEAARQRYGERLNLELMRVDLAEAVVDAEPVDLVHAALVFEHAGTGRCLDNAVSLVAKGGALSMVLQRPGTGHDVGASGVASVQAAREHFALVDPAWMTDTLKERGFRLVHTNELAVPGGKGMWLAVYAR
ncbi:MAG TPA: class I SAM-dependent methyltransferase [Acidobacteriaceae bacterium]|jgi:SAM-dependent methyltransferase